MVVPLLDVMKTRGAPHRDFGLNQKMFKVNLELLSRVHDWMVRMVLRHSQE
jgi:hypothetical protein